MWLLHQQSDRGRAQYRLDIRMKHHARRPLLSQQPLAFFRDGHHPPPALALFRSRQETFILELSKDWLHTTGLERSLLLQVIQRAETALGNQGEEEEGHHFG
jgi:hypothetical protein